MNLQSLQPFTKDAGAIESALARVVPYGQTSLYDAIAQTAQRVADAPPGDRSPARCHRAHRRRSTRAA